MPVHPPPHLPRLPLPTHKGGKQSSGSGRQNPTGVDMDGRWCCYTCGPSLDIYISCWRQKVNYLPFLPVPALSRGVSVCVCACVTDACMCWSRVPKRPSGPLALKWTNLSLHKHAGVNRMFTLGMPNWEKALWGETCNAPPPPPTLAISHDSTHEGAWFMRTADIKL